MTCGCAFSGPDDPVLRASASGLARGTLEADPFVLTRYLRSAPAAERLTVYLEGDAPAWHPDRVRVTAEPPPLHPLALDLAAADPAPSVAWLGRPCQLVTRSQATGCEPSLWADRRFSRTIVDALGQGLDALRRETGARRLTLVGYSGGGVLAVLLAAERPDVERVVTVAAPLDLGAWIAHHELGPLDARDPARLPPTALDGVVQIHLLGERDAVVPPALLDRYRQRFPDAHVEIVARRWHGGWAEDWPKRITAARSLPPRRGEP